jgi:DNA polymerase-3 subunit epsilon
MKLLYLDLETTGVDPKRCSIVQVAYLVEVDGKVVDASTFFIKPFKDCIIEPGALALSDVVPTAQQEGITYSEAFTRIHNMLEKYVDKFKRSDKFFLIGYNVRFDDDFMREMWKKYKDNYYGSWFFWPPIDVAVLACQFLMKTRHQMPDFKLSTVVRTLGLERVGSAHDALSDIHITRGLYLKVNGGK